MLSIRFRSVSRPVLACQLCILMMDALVSPCLASAQCTGRNCFWFLQSISGAALWPHILVRNMVVRVDFSGAHAPQPLPHQAASYRPWQVWSEDCILHVPVASGLADVV